MLACQRSPCLVSPLRHDVACCFSTSRGISAMLMPRSKATSAQCRRHVQRQSGAVVLDLAAVDGGALAYLGFGLRIGQLACTDTDVLAAHGDHLSNSSTRLLTPHAMAVLVHVPGDRPPRFR